MQVWVYGALLVVVLVLFKKSEGYKITTNGYDEYYGKDLAYLGFLGPTVTYPNVTACKSACDAKSGCVGFTVSRNKFNSNQRSCQMKARPPCAKTSPHKCNKFEEGRLQRKTNVRDFMIRNSSRTAFVNRNFRYEITKPSPMSSAPAPTPAPVKVVQGSAASPAPASVPVNNGSGWGIGVYVTAYEHTGFSGKNKKFLPGDYNDVTSYLDTNTHNFSWNNKISSIQVPPHVIAYLYKGNNLSGANSDKVLSLAGPTDIKNIGSTYPGWNDSINSMKVVYVNTPDLRKKWQDAKANMDFSGKFVS